MKQYPTSALGSIYCWTFCDRGEGGRLSDANFLHGCDVPKEKARRGGAGLAHGRRADGDGLRVRQAAGLSGLSAGLAEGDGFRHGDYKEYYDNGEVKIKGQYKKDHKEGTWKFYAENGKLLQKIKFENGKRLD